MLQALLSILPLMTGLAGPAMAGKAPVVFGAGASTQPGADSLVCAPIPIRDSAWPIWFVPLLQHNPAPVIAIGSSKPLPAEEVVDRAVGLRSGSVGTQPLGSATKTDRPFPSDPDGGSVPSAGPFPLLALAAAVGARRRRDPP
jgi:MYXO-CTERM domain-containing protein